jgi:hypothetical protein
LPERGFFAAVTGFEEAIPLRIAVLKIAESSAT